ncbi:acetamidase/formamidase family protein [Bradyrhizobium sp. AS23.2]|uniref:acetamidase/formamidase family protein n=1 Tax=Bradyrhizobium sp. AS23.2 TaxID=1680155 RepID=UPI0024BF1703|nr:acetamidase/formamidase family protein [Bradyrhizobium sp. AS23.2]
MTANVDATNNHSMSGPVFIEGAKRGDALAVTVVDIAPADHGYTARLHAGQGEESSDFCQSALARMTAAAEISLLRGSDEGGAAKGIYTDRTRISRRPSGRDLRKHRNPGGRRALARPILSCPLKITP